MTGAPKVVCPIAKQSPLDKRLCERYADNWFDEEPMATHHCQGRLCTVFKTLYPELDTGIRKSEAARPEPKASHNCDSAALPDSLKEAKKAFKAQMREVDLAQVEAGRLWKAEQEACERGEKPYVCGGVGNVTFAPYTEPPDLSIRLKELESQLGVCMEAIRSLSDRVDQLECAKMARSRAKKVNHPDTP